MILDKMLNFLCSIAKRVHEEQQARTDYAEINVKKILKAAQEKQRGIHSYNSAIEGGGISKNMTRTEIKEKSR